jgi:Uma2 family endonuclease
MMGSIALPNPPKSTKLLTAEEFVREYDGQAVELVKGHVVELPMPTARHGKVCNWIAYFLTQFVLQRDLGHVMTNDSWIAVERDPDSVRGPDVCYFSYSRLPKGPVPEGLLDVLPELVFEVRSPSDRWTKVVEKMVEYLDGGVSVVVILDPNTQSATVYRADERQTIFEADQTLIIPDVLPEFAVPIKSFFE